MKNKRDYAVIQTDDILGTMIADIESVYGQACEDLREQAEKFTKWLEKEDKKKRKLLKKGEINLSEYRQWLQTQLLTGRNQLELLSVIAANLTNTNRIADSIINGYMPQVYATNLNYTVYSIDKHYGVGMAFAIYDEQTVERLIRENPDLLPKAKVDIPKDMRWNKQKLNSSIMQGILQGQTVEQVADSLQRVSDMNRNSAIRNAVTMTTSAQNGGRLDGMKYAQRMGIDCNKRWVATLDGHTRHSHRLCDGEIRKINEKFSNGLLYPADPNGIPAEVYNCRCTLISAFNDSQFDVSIRNNRINVSGSKIRNMSYTEWKNAHGGEPIFRAARNVNRDMRMHEEYVDLLGSQVPRNFREFQEFKYSDTAAWKEMISAARKARNKRRNRQ